jgi:predicted methyltransferase
MVANDDYQAAVANLSRMDRDRARDGGRNPTEVMAFFGIEPGMAVLDMFAGGGYYTELLAHVVGPDGKVVSHSNQAYANFVGDEANERYAGNRLPNVEILMAENNALDLPEAHFDVVTLILAYHDIYYEAPENGWPKIDGPRLLAELYNGLKPGGVLGVVDHVAEAGSPRETGGTLHRIDPAIVIEEIRGAGFILEGESDVLRNTQDDHLLNMADPSVRGKTDRFVLRFRKPE